MDYQVYTLDTDDHITCRHDIKCESDAMAIAFAQSLLPGVVAMEVWNLDRMVGRVPSLDIPLVPAWPATTPAGQHATAANDATAQTARPPGTVPGRQHWPDATNPRHWAYINGN